jgi:hypothetical protein
MNLKTATLIALVCVVISTLMFQSQTHELIKSVSWSADNISAAKAFNTTATLIETLGFVIFFAALYTKQK